jgi:hypothetical protein
MNVGGLTTGIDWLANAFHSICLAQVTTIEQENLFLLMALLGRFDF